MPDETRSEVWPPAPQTAEPPARPGRATLPFRRGLPLTAILTAILGLLPFLIYAPARLMGAIPSEDGWGAAAEDGGPWAVSPLGMLIVGCTTLLPVLALMSLVVCVAAALSRRWIVAALWGGLVVAQLGLALLQLVTVSWAAL